MQGIHAHPFGFWTYGYAARGARHEGDGQDDHLGGGAELGSVPQSAPGWFGALVSLVPGGSGKVAEMEAYIRSQARAGAEEAIPTIRAEVQKTATPYIVGAGILALGGFLFGLGAFRVARSR